MRIAIAVIPPTDAPYLGEIELNHRGLTQLQGLVGGFIESVPIRDHGAIAYVNEDGKRLQLAVNPTGSRLAALPGDVILGPMVVVGFPDDEGNDTPVPASILASLGIAPVS